MQAKRAERISVLIKEELASTIAKRIRDPRIGFITVTHAKVSDDLKYAEVFYSVMGTEEEKKKTREGLEQARGFLQQDLARTLKLRCTPHLIFTFDPSLEEGMKIDAIIEKIHKKDESTL